MPDAQEAGWPETPLQGHDGLLKAIAPVSAGVKGLYPGVDIFDGMVFEKMAGSRPKKFLPTNNPDREHRNVVVIMGLLPIEWVNFDFSESF